jgi:hypothetical protein
VISSEIHWFALPPRKSFPFQPLTLSTHSNFSKTSRFLLHQNSSYSLVFLTTLLFTILNHLHFLLFISLLPYHTWGKGTMLSQSSCAHLIPWWSWKLIGTKDPTPFQSFSHTLFHLILTIIQQRIIIITIIHFTDEETEAQSSSTFRLRTCSWWVKLACKSHVSPTMTRRRTWGITDSLGSKIGAKLNYPNNMWIITIVQFQNVVQTNSSIRYWLVAPISHCAILYLYSSYFWFFTYI